MKFELNINEIDWQTEKPGRLYQSGHIEAENYNAALKKAKSELREINKDLKKNWEKDQAELGMSLPLNKCVITKLEEWGK